MTEGVHAGGRSVARFGWASFSSLRLIDDFRRHAVAYAALGLHVEALAVTSGRVTFNRNISSASDYSGTRVLWS